MSAETGQSEHKYSYNMGQNFINNKWTEVLLSLEDRNQNKEQIYEKLFNYLSAIIGVRRNDVIPLP